MLPENKFTLNVLRPEDAASTVKVFRTVSTDKLASPAVQTPDPLYDCGTVPAKK